MKYQSEVDALRTKILSNELQNLSGIEKAVWSAAYVQILAASMFQEGINSTAEMIGDPTEHRVLIAVNGANSAIKRLRVVYDTSKLEGHSL